MVFEKKSKAIIYSNSIHKDDKNISFAIVFQFCLLITNYTYKLVFNISNPSTRAIVSSIFMIIAGVFFIRCINVVIKRIGRLFFTFYFATLLFVLSNMLLFFDNIQYIKSVSFYIFLICIPIFLYYFAIRDKSILLEMLLKSAYYQMTLGIIFFISSDLSVLRYDMVYSYLVLVPTVILLYKIYNKLKIIDIVLVGFGIFSIVVMGSRGPLLALIIFWIVLIANIIVKDKNYIKKIIYSIIVFIVLFLGIFYFKDIIYFFDTLLCKLGISSRTINILLDQNADFSSGRATIFKITIEQIRKRPITGYGLAGDRVFLDGTYPHNIFLEILSQFGVIVGGFIIIVTVLYWTYGIFMNKDKTNNDLAIIFFGVGLVQLFVSGSYLTSSNYWLFMAICVNSVHSNIRMKKAQSIMYSTMKDIQVKRVV